MLIDSTKLEPVLIAIDKLNSYVRSPGYDSFYCNTKKPIYWMKDKAIRLALEAFPVEPFRITAKAKCHSCNGTGEFTGWWTEGWDQQGEDCFKCGATGTATLSFVELKISLSNGKSISWHIPSHKWPESTILLADIPTKEDSDYAPHQQGKSLSIIEVAENLNIAESYFEKQIYDFFIHFSSDFYYFNYSFYLGDVNPGICHLCNSASEIHRFGVTKDLYWWIGLACQKCRVKHYKEDIRELFSLPEITQHEALRAWQQRHLKYQLDRDAWLERKRKNWEAVGY